MNNKEFARKLESRTLRFGIQVMRFSATLPNSSESKVIRNQLSKAGTSIGANYREANRSRSKADFRNKIKICESEASETCYWLEMVKSLNWSQKDIVDELYSECDELVAMFTSIGRKLK
jgi:four helix bundle protein